jgi:hypothetical protein
MGDGAMTNEEKNNALFVSLLLMFHSAAMQSLGKLKNPATDKIERNLEQAQSMIDMFDMLKVKTNGNLTPEEDKFLSNLAQELKLNYVDEASKSQTAGEESK